MKDCKSADLAIGDYVAFTRYGQTKGRTIGEVVEIRDNASSSNIRVVYTAATPLIHGSFFAGVFHKAEEEVSSHMAHTQWLNASDTEVIAISEKPESAQTADATSAPIQSA